MVTLASPAGQSLKALVPASVYARSRVFDNIFQAQGSEIDRLDEAVATLDDQWFIATATYTLPRWEEEYDVPVIETQSIESRRSKVEAKIRGVGTATKDLIQNVALAYDNGDIEIIEDFHNYQVFIRFISVGGVPENVADLQAAIRAVLPAHIAPVYDFNWSLWDELDSAALDWNELDALGLSWDSFDRLFV